jgi:H+/Cl- antiporter ClcA
VYRCASHSGAASVCNLTLTVSVVSVSMFDALVHTPPLVVVVIVSVVVLRLLVPPAVQV